MIEHLNRIVHSIVMAVVPVVLPQVRGPSSAHIAAKRSTKRWCCRPTW